MKKEKIELTVTLLVGIIAAAFLFFATVKYILPVAMPFLIGWFVALAVRAPARRIAGVIRVSERIARVLTALVFSLAFFGFATVLLWQTVTLVWNLLSEIGSGENPIYGVLTSLADGNFIFSDSIPEELASRISDALGEVLSGALTSVAAAITELAGSVPSALLFLLVTVISIIYFAIDLEKINTRVGSLLPNRVGSFLSGVWNSFFKVAGKYTGSYLIIMLMTFAIMTVGLLILGVKNALTIAFIIAVFDLLPIIGVGTVLIPWSILAFATGDHYMGIGLILLFVANTVIREMAEPKIVGRSLGIHPIISLIIIYAGYALFGIYGLLLTPVIAAVIGLFIEKDDTAEIS